MYCGPCAQCLPSGGYAGNLNLKPEPEPELFLVGKDNTGKDKGDVGKDEDDIEKDKGAFIGFQEEDSPQADARDDGLEDIWREMSMAIKCSKVRLCYFVLTSKKM